MSSFKHKRKLSNMFLQPGLQLRHGLYYFSFVFTTIVLVQWLTFVSLRSAIIKFQVGKDQADLLAWIDPTLSALDSSSFFILGGFATIGFIFGVAITHKVFGPTLAMKRFIGDLKNGEYGTQISLRKGDQLADLAEELNQLSLHLAKIHPKNKAELHLITQENQVIKEETTHEKKSA